MSFDFFQNLRGNFFFVFLSFDLSLEFPNISLPEKVIFFILILSPLLTLIFRLRLFEPIESGVETILT